MTVAERIDIQAEIAAITRTLATRRDPAYEWGMRRTVPSEQPAHATRVPDVRRTASEWRREHKGLPVEDLLAVCDALWQTPWREERIVAIALVRGNREAMHIAGWQRFERWSEDIDNWEHVDHLADVTGRVLADDRSLLKAVESLSTIDNPWQRLLSLVTLIVAFRQDAYWRAELESMATRLESDKHPLVRRAVVWAKDRLAKDHIGE